MTASLAQKAEARRLYNKLHPEKVRATNRRRQPAAHEWYLKNKPTVITKARQNFLLRKAKDPEKIARMNRASRMVRVFGITVEQYDALLKFQGGVCALCGKPPKAKRLAIDHDHATKRIRGLLCTFDNHRFVGRHRDPAKFRAAAAYLEHPPAEEVIYAA